MFKNCFRVISELVGNPTQNVLVASKDSKIALNKSDKGTRDGIFPGIIKLKL